MSTDLKKEKLVKFEYTSGGMFLQDSILSFDTQKSGVLSFLSEASFLTHDNSITKFITTEENVKLLSLKKRVFTPLTCQYNRPFSIGSLKMELLPSGSSLGGASLYVEHNKNRILYAPYICTQKFSTLRQFQLKRASTLVLGAFLSDENLKSNRKKQKDRLIERIKSYLSDDIYPVILCRPTPIAQEIVHLLSSESIPVATHSSIHAINKIYESFGSNIGNYSLYSKYTKNKVVILPFNTHKPYPQDKPVLTIKDNYDPNSSDDESCFYLYAYCNVKELKEIITTVSPKEVYIIGPYTKKYCEELNIEGISIYPLYPNGQESLF